MEQQPTPQPTLPITNDDTVKVRYITFLPYIGTPEEVEKTLAKRFEEIHPEIEVNVARYRRDPLSYLKSDSPPDILMYNTSYDLYSFAEQGLIADLREIWAETELLDTLSPGLRSLGEWDGGLYWIPFAYSWSAIYYNKQIFDEFGLEPPTTWEDFLFLCDTLLANNVTPLALAGSSPWASSLWFDYLNLRMNGAEFHRRLTRGQESYDSAQVRDVFEAWTGLLEQGYFGENAHRSLISQSMRMVLNSDERLPNSEGAAMILLNSLTFTEVSADTRQKFEAQTGFFRFPLIQPDIPNAEVTSSLGYIIPANAQNWQQAVEYLAFLSIPDVQLELKQRAGPTLNYIPSNIGNRASNLSAETQYGIQLINDADELVLGLFIESPERMQKELDRVLRRFANGREKVEQLQQALEKARQDALEEGLFIAP